MGYNRYIYSDATLKAKAANNKAGLLKNKKRSDIVAYGTELVLSQIKYEPKSYLEYGPYWWAMKKVINARGGNLGDTMRKSRPSTKAPVTKKLLPQHSCSWNIT